VDAKVGHFRCLSSQQPEKISETVSGNPLKTDYERVRTRDHFKKQRDLNPSQGS